MPLLHAEEAIWVSKKWMECDRFDNFPSDLILNGIPVGSKKQKEKIIVFEKKNMIRI